MDAGIIMVSVVFGIPMIVLAVIAVWWRCQRKVDAQIVSVEPRHYGLSTRYELTYSYEGDDGETHGGKAVHRWRPARNTMPVLVCSSNPKKCMPVENWWTFAAGAGLLFFMILLTVLVPLLYRSPF